MRRFVCVLSFCFLAACQTTPVTPENVAKAATSLDFGDGTSETLTSKAWDALNDKNYVAAIAYAQTCIERYGDEGKKMNAGLTTFAPT